MSPGNELKSYLCQLSFTYIGLSLWHRIQSVQKNIGCGLCKWRTMQNALILVDIGMVIVLRCLIHLVSIDIPMRQLSIYRYLSYCPRMRSLLLHHFRSLPGVPVTDPRAVNTPLDCFCAFALFRLCLDQRGRRSGPHEVKNRLHCGKTKEENICMK